MVWANYKWRFVPWLIGKGIAQNSVKLGLSEDMVISEAHLLNQIQKVCRLLHEELSTEKYEQHITAELFDRIQNATAQHRGFTLERRTSNIPHGGYGVFVKQGEIPKHSLVAFYPGTVYHAGETVFLQSIANSFVFRCADGRLVDGNDRGISKLLYRSCSFRDRIGPLLTSDQTWLTSYPANPLALGQYVNNHTADYKANVMYQEADLPLLHFPLLYRRYIPNIPYNSAVLSSSEDPVMRMVLLVSTRDIECGEEILSSYLTLIESKKK